MRIAPMTAAGRNAMIVLVGERDLARHAPTAAASTCPAPPWRSQPAGLAHGHRQQGRGGKPDARGPAKRELRGRRITVNAVAPGPVATELFLTGSPEHGLLPRCRRWWLGQLEDTASCHSWPAPDSGLGQRPAPMAAWPERGVRTGIGAVATTVRGSPTRDLPRRLRLSRSRSCR